MEPASLAGLAEMPVHPLVQTDPLHLLFSRAHADCEVGFVEHKGPDHGDQGGRLEDFRHVD